MDINDIKASSLAQKITVTPVLATAEEEKYASWIESFDDYDEDCVEMIFNSASDLNEPMSLPAKFPNILVNGANGIAIGLATNIPTHNLGEVISGAIAMIDNRDITLEEMMKIIPGPDFPTGGIQGLPGRQPALRPAA